MDEWDIQADVDKTKLKLRRIFTEQNLAIPDESAVSKNSGLVRDFFVEHVFDELFERYFGFSAETDDIWPQKHNAIDNIVQQAGRKWPRLFWKVVLVEG